MAKSTQPDKHQPAVAVEVLPCADGDWPHVINLLTAVYVGEGYVSNERAAQFYRREVLEPNGTVLVAKDNRSVLGVVFLPHRESPVRQVAREGEAEFRFLAVDSRGRGRGIGQQLVSTCIDQAVQPPLGAKMLVLWTRPQMASARRLYERLGFQRTPERDAALPALPPDQALIERWVYARPL